MIGVVKNCSRTTFMDNFVLLIFFIIQKVFLKSLEMQFFSGIFPIHFIDVGVEKIKGDKSSPVFICCFCSL